MSRYNLENYDEENPDLFYEFLNDYNDDMEEPFWDEIDSTWIGGQIVDLWNLHKESAKLKKPNLRTRTKRSSVNRKADVFKAIIPDLHITEDFNGQTLTTFRKEQADLRKGLLGGCGVGKCVICGRQYPADMLWTAHIKKRSQCSVEEKGDLNVVALMCKVGCDDLFERGYIAVKKGKIISLRDGQTDALREKMNQIEGRECIGFCKKNTDYYEWHAKNHLEGAER